MSKSLRIESKGFTAGETQNAAPATADTLDPQAIAERILHHRNSSVKEEVNGDALLGESVSKLRNDRKQLKQLMTALVTARIPSTEEANLGPDAPKSRLCKLMKIGEYAHVIFDERILPFLQPGYSVLYQLVLLYRILEANDESN